MYELLEGQKRYYPLQNSFALRNTSVLSFLGSNISGLRESLKSDVQLDERSNDSAYNVSIPRYAVGCTLTRIVRKTKALLIALPNLLTCYFTVPKENSSTQSTMVS